MRDVIDNLFARYRNRGILIDTNILLLYFIGSINRARISEFKRTQQFIPEDYDTLLKIIDYFYKVITTPNILTEVNSLANQLGEPERSHCFTIFGQNLSGLEEFYTESRIIAQNDKFTKFGLTDCGIINLVRDRYLVLTDDLRLANYLQKEGIDTVNFNNIRIYGWR